MCIHVYCYLSLLRLGVSLCQGLKEEALPPNYVLIVGERGRQFSHPGMAARGLAPPLIGERPYGVRRQITGGCIAPRG